MGAKLYWFCAIDGLCIYERAAGLQWTQADVSISISMKRRLGGAESALAVGACLYYLAKKQRSIGVMRSVGGGRRDLWPGRLKVRRASVAAGAGGVAVVVGGGSMASTISLIDRVSKRGLFFLTRPHSVKRRIINRNFPMLSI